MKWLCLLLIGANLILFATGRGDGSLWGGRQREPERVARQVLPEAIRTLSPARVAQLEQRGRTPTVQDGLVTCLELGGFGAEELPRAEGAFARLDLGARLGTRRAEEPSSYMVYIPSQGSQEAAQRRADELRRRGVEDFAILQEAGPLRFSISLGVFRSEEAAQKRLAELLVQEVRSARIVPRSGGVAKTYFQVRYVDPSLRARLEALRAEFGAYDWRECPAAS